MGPKPSSGMGRKATELASAVLTPTVLPHHVASVVAPIVPSLGYWSVKKIKMIAIATPASRPADRMSGEEET